MIGAYLQFIMRSRWTAIVAIAATAILPPLLPTLAFVLLPLALVFSGASLALAILRNGPREGILVLVGAAGLCMLFGALLFGHANVPLQLVAPYWTGCAFVAWRLYRTRLMTHAVVVATLVGCVPVLWLHIVLSDPVEFWKPVMSQMLAAAQRSGTLPGQQEVDRFDALLSLAPYMTPWLGFVSTLTLLIGLFLARSWQATLDRPGAFGQEFRRLRLGRVTLGLCLILGAFVLMTGFQAGSAALDVLGPIAAMLIVQGLAIVHALTYGRRLRGVALGMLYATLLVIPKIAWPLIIAIALADGWLDLRRRLDVDNRS